MYPYGLDPDDPSRRPRTSARLNAQKAEGAPKWGAPKHPYIFSDSLARARPAFSDSLARSSKIAVYAILSQYILRALVISRRPHDVAPNRRRHL